jgi:hypothetical protein
MFKSISLLFWFLFPLLSLSLADGDGGGGGQPPSTPPPATPPAPNPDPGVAAGINNLIERYNSDMRAVIDKLYTENYSYRETIRDLKEQNDDLKSRIPKDSQAVLPKEDAQLLEQYKELGEPDAIKELQGELETTKEQLGALQKDQVLRDVAEAAGFKLPVLKRLGAELDYELREVEQDGEKQTVAYVKNGDGEAKPLADYAKDQWADFMPALTAEPQPPAQQGTRYPAQDAGSPTPKGNVVDEFISGTNKARAEKPNPLVKQQ